MIALTFDCQQAVDRLCRGVGGGVTRVALDQLDRLAEHATGRVDVLDGELDAGDLGRAEEGEEPVCGSRVPMVSGPPVVAVGDRSRAGVGGGVGLVAGDDELGLRVVDLVVVAELQQAEAGLRRLTGVGEARAGRTTPS